MSRPEKAIAPRGAKRGDARADAARHQGAVEAFTERKIVDEPAAPGEETLVLDAPDRLADHPYSSRSSSRRS